MKKALLICCALGTGAFLLGFGRAPTAEGETHSISGRILLEGRTRHDSVTVCVDSLHCAETDSLGSYVITGLEDGGYLVQARAPRCLYHIVDTVRVSGGDVAGIDDTLLAGDVIADGRINLLDAGEILRHYHATAGGGSWDGASDVDANGIIDSLDLALLMRHWKESADPLPASRITVNGPIPATVWYRGHGGTVTWTTGGLGGDVSISLYKGNVWASSIVDLTRNDGSYSDVAVPRGLPTGNDYRVRVTHDAVNFDYSSAFHIDARLEVLEPTQATVWLFGQENVPISWDTGDLGGTVGIFLYKGTTLVDTIASSAPNNGSYVDYCVPREGATDSVYRIQVYYDETHKALSGSFRMQYGNGPIRVVEPNLGTRWIYGQANVPIIWETGYLGGNVSILLRRWSRLTLVDTIASSTPNDGTFNEYVVRPPPQSWYPSVEYCVEVTFDKDHRGLSDFFEVQNPFPWDDRVTEPHTGTVWALGQDNVAIYWNDRGLGGEASIDLYDGNNLIATIATTVPNSGSYTDYDVPAGLSPGGSYRIRVNLPAEGSTLESTDFEIRSPRPPGWSILYPYPQAHTLNGVSFTVANTATAVGDYGTIIRTTDGGTSWATVWSGTRNHLNGVSFADPNIGIAVGDYGTILATTNGGATWTPLRSGMSVKLNAVTFTSLNAATIVGNAGVVLQTVDGGATWTGQIPAANLVYGHAIDLKGVSFADATHGIAVGGSGTIYWKCEQVILQTSNGGAAWTERLIAGENPDPVPTGVAFSSNTGIIVGYGLSLDADYQCCSRWGYISRSSDGGTTWTLVGQTRQMFAVSYIGQNTFVAVGNGAMRSTDGGMTWSQWASSDDLRALSHRSPMTGLAVGGAGAIFKTDNYGATWVTRNRVVPTDALSRLSFGSASVGFATPAGWSGLFRTGDGGITWTKQGISEQHDSLYDISFVSESVGMVVGGYRGYTCEYCGPGRGVIYGTTNGGANWVQKLRRPGVPFYGIALIDSLTATVVGRYGLIIRTTDGGATWLEQTSGTSVDLLRVFFTDANTGTVVGSRGKILRTTDGGTTWETRPCGTTARLVDLFFTDADTGTVIGWGGTILRTEDGGATWTSQTSGTGVRLSGVFFSDAMTGTIVGNGGTILRTTDGGAIWRRQDSPVMHDLRDVWLTDSMTGIVTGDYGVVLKTTTGGE